MFWEEYLIKEEETVEKHPERDGEDGKVKKDYKNGIDWDELEKDPSNYFSSINKIIS